MSSVPFRSPLHSEDENLARQLAAEEDESAARGEFVLEQNAEISMHEHLYRGGLLELLLVRIK